MRYTDEAIQILERSRGSWSDGCLWQKVISRVAMFLEILSGPDQGKQFPLESELLHLGRGTDNAVVLSDPELGDFHASMSVQSGQLSLYANESNQIRVCGTPIPGQQWVAVPPGAKIHLGGQTEVCCVASSSKGTETIRSLAAETTVSPPERKRPARKESKRQVARPIAGRSGEAAVQLGADGKLPQLSLATGTGPKRRAEKPKETNPALLFTILAASSLSSAALLLVDFETTSVVSSSDQEFARSRLPAFYGKDSANLEPYQKLLRRAAVEHSQGNRTAERQLLRQVLGLLHSVDASAPENLNGLTGRQTGRGKTSDRELEEIIQQVLN